MRSAALRCESRRRRSRSSWWCRTASTAAALSRGFHGQLQASASMGCRFSKSAGSPCRHLPDRCAPRRACRPRIVRSPGGPPCCRGATGAVGRRWPGCAPHGSDPPADWAARRQLASSCRRRNSKGHKKSACPCKSQCRAACALPGRETRRRRCRWRQGELDEEVRYCVVERIPLELVAVLVRVHRHHHEVGEELPVANAPEIFSEIAGVHLVAHVAGLRADLVVLAEQLQPVCPICWKSNGH